MNAAPRPPAPSPLHGVTLVTGNRHKVEEARRLLGADGEGLEAAAVDLPEIQSLDLEEVLAAKADEAFRRLRRPVIVEDTGVGLHALGGFPGPLIKWMLEAAGIETIAATAHALGDPRALVRCGLLYRDSEGSVSALVDVPGTLSATPRGRGGFGWDPIFQPDAPSDAPSGDAVHGPSGAPSDDAALTYAEMSTERKDVIGHRGRAWRKLLQHLRRR